MLVSACSSTAFVLTSASHCLPCCIIVQDNTMGPLWEMHEEKPQSSLNLCEMKPLCSSLILGESCSISTFLLNPCNLRVIAGAWWQLPLRTLRNHVPGHGLSNWNASSFFFKVNPGGKTLEERRSSLDAEIDSLTSILADLESSSPYKPRIQQVGGMCGPEWESGQNQLLESVC